MYITNLKKEKNTGKAKTKVSELLLLIIITRNSEKV